MKISALTLASSCILASLAAADANWKKATSNEVAYLSCSALITKSATFCAVQKAKCFCKNQPALASIASCYINGFGNSTTKINYFLDETCSKQGNVTLTLDEFYASYENATANHLFVNSTASDFNATAISYYPIEISAAKVDRSWESQKARYFNENRSVYYGSILIAYWFLVMFLAGAINWTLYFCPRLGHNGFTKSWKKYISMPALGRYNHDVEKSVAGIFKWLVPTRLETLLIVIWFALIIAFETSNYHHVNKDTIWKKKEAEIGRYIGDRSGITGTSLIPLLLLFAGRNNFMQFFTRWSYSRMLTLHRWTARAVFIILLIHAAAMSCSSVALGKYQSRNQKTYMRWGIVAYVACGIMMFQGLLFFRKRCYEVFYIIHLLMAVFFVIGAWIHVSEFAYAPWLYAASAVWCFDRFLRILRLIAFGAPIATVEAKAEETLKVTVSRPSYWKPSPGQHAFVHFWRPLSFFQSHPFTIVDSITNDNTITFYIKIKGGITSSLYKYVNASTNKTAQIRVSVEGPYGSAAPLKRYDNTVFLAGGHGVPGLYFETMEALKRNSPNQTVKFYWIIRHWKSLDWFYSELANFANTTVKPIVYISQPDHVDGLVLPSALTSTESDTDEEKKSNEFASTDIVSELKSSLPYIEFREGRPDIAAIVHEEVNNAQGSLAIVACAHVNMVDDARRAVVNELGGAKNDIEFFDQIQVW